MHILYYGGLYSKYACIHAEVALFHLYYLACISLLKDFLPAFSFPPFTLSL